jgi:hypothetical protein
MAGELADLHGVMAVDVARRAYRMRDQEGNTQAAEFWLALSILVDDVLRHGLDPEDGPSIQ